MNAKNSITPIITGAAVTMAVGTAAYMMSGKSSKENKKQLKKTATQAIQAVGDVVDGITTMMK